MDAYNTEYLSFDVDGNTDITDEFVGLSKGTYYLKGDNGGYYYSRYDYSFLVNKLSGWIQDEYRKWRYIDSTTGDIKIGWAKINNIYYYFDSDGVMQTGWFLQGNNGYYIYNRGVMQTG